MKPAPFTMHRPRALAEVLELLDRHRDDARLIAGGQSLVPLMNLRLASPAILIDLNRVADLAGIRQEGDDVRIGAVTRQQELLESRLVQTKVPLLAAAARHIGHLSTRCRGTVGGSLANADPASELVLAAITLGAQVTVQSAAQTRTLAAGEFIRDALTTALAPTEVVTELVIPVAPEGSRVAFREHARRAGDFAIAAAAIQLSPKEGVLRAGLGAVGPIPVTCRRVEHAFRRGRLANELEALVAADVADVDAITDLRSSASYRRKLAAFCLADCIKDVIA
jgi:aerobic carbon-monoxide dehydrogenase medium subunit